jgi:hypothetical protein
MFTRISQVDSIRLAINKPNDRANIISIWGLPDGQPYQGAWCADDATIASGARPCAASEARLPPSGRRAIA